MRYLLSGLCLLAASTFGGLAYAHHGWGSYDAARTLAVSSSIQSVDWQNPHVMVMVKHENKDWHAVLAPPFRMSARGLEPDMLKPGTPVKLEGYPSTRTDAELRAERITVGDKTFELR